MISVRLAALASLLMLAGGLPAQESVQPMPTGPILGTWEGEMPTPQWPQFITLTLRAPGSDGGSTVEMFGGTFATATRQMDDESVMMQIGEGPQSFEIHAALREGQLVGTLAQGSDTLPFRLRRIPELPAPRDRVDAGHRRSLDAVHRAGSKLQRRRTRTLPGAPR